MINNEALLNLIHREVFRVLARSTRRTPAVVDSYDPTTYAAKFKLMPDSEDTAVVTGWISLGTPQSGNNYGWHQPPEIGAHGWLEFHEGDREAAVWHASQFNDQFQPVQTQSGETQYITKWGSLVYFKNDGSVTIKDKNGSDSIVMDGNGTVTITATTINLVGNVHLGATGGQPAALQGSVDSHGDNLVSALATKVWVT
jgi:uncharacterized protein involved in type VI secretion and phage assembly